MIRELFNAPILVRRDIRPAAPRDLQPGVGPAPVPPVTRDEVVEREGAFLTVQSLASFPGAVAAVTLIVKIVAFGVPAWSGNRWLYIVAAALVGIAIYTINESDPLAPSKSPKQRGLGIGIAVLNTFVILSAAVGADAMTRSSGTPQEQTTNPTTNAASNVETNHV
jgi:hypothetical protein